MVKRVLLTFALVCSGIANLSFTLIGQSSWPQFRGPSGQGVFEADKLPVSWSEDEGVEWKLPIHGRGWSSPVAADGKIWLSTATEDGKNLSGLCVAADSGEVLWDEVLFTVAEPQFAHKFNSYASPTPVIDGDRVYITFGSEGTSCIDVETRKILWAREDIECNHFRGAGSSPIIHGDLLIMNFDGSDHQFVIALDKMNGKTVWQTKRSVDFQDLNEEGLPDRDGDWRKAFSTPHIAGFEERLVLLSIGSMGLYAYEPINGKEIWRVESRVGHSAGTRPTVTNGRIVYCTGFSKGELWCVKPGGQGVVSDSHVQWKMKRSVSNKPSLIYFENSIFMIHDGGVASCIDIESGKPVWQERVGGNYSASPLLNQGKIYFFSEEGKTTIINASRQFNIEAVNHLKDGFMASPAVVGSSLVLRTKSSLYRISGK